MPDDLLRYKNLVEAGMNVNVACKMLGHSYSTISKELIKNAIIVDLNRNKTTGKRYLIQKGFW